MIFLASLLKHILRMRISCANVQIKLNSLIINNSVIVENRAFTSKLLTKYENDILYSARLLMKNVLLEIIYMKF